MTKKQRAMANAEWFTIEWSDTGDQWQTVYSANSLSDAKEWWKHLPNTKKFYRLVEHSTLRVWVPD